MIAKTNEQFLSELLERNESYRNNEFIVMSEYKGANNNLLVKGKYGICSLQGSNLLNGSKPSIRTAVDKTEYIINQFKEVHGNRYDYSLVEYNGRDGKVNIICPINGQFSIIPYYHLKRNYSPFEGEQRKLEYRKQNSGGFSKTKWFEKGIKSKNFAGWTFYVVELKNDKECFTKIGRTYRSINSRLSCLKKHYKVKLLKFKTNTNLDYCSMEEIYNLETKVKRKYKQYSYKPLIKFNGYRECYLK